MNLFIPIWLLITQLPSITSYGPLYLPIHSHYLINQLNLFTHFFSLLLLLQMDLYMISLHTLRFVNTNFILCTLCQHTYTNKCYIFSAKTFPNHHCTMEGFSETKPQKTTSKTLIPISSLLLFFSTI